MFRLILIGLTCVFATNAGHAQTTSTAASNVGSATDTTQIAGTTAPVCTVETLTPVATVQLDTQASQPITDVLYVCNNVDGFVRKISSENGGRLVRGDQDIPYRASGAGTNQLAFPPVSLSGPYITTVPSFADLPIGANGILSFSISQLPRRLLAGEYTDTITIDITPN